VKNGKDAARRKSGKTGKIASIANFEINGSRNEPIPDLCATVPKTAAAFH
jgi:hypothetical protein